MHIRPFAAQDKPAVVALWQQCNLTRPWNDPHKDIARKVEEILLAPRLPESEPARAQLQC